MSRDVVKPDARSPYAKYGKREYQYRPEIRACIAAVKSGNKDAYDEQNAAFWRALKRERRI